MSNLKETLWARKYEPKTIDDYIGNDEFVAKVKHWIEIGDVPNLILYSEKSGTGKSRKSHRAWSISSVL